MIGPHRSLDLESAPFLLDRRCVQTLENDIGGEGVGEVGWKGAALVSLLRMSRTL